jgi:hypothetical protein
MKQGLFIIGCLIVVVLTQTVPPDIGITPKETIVTGQDCELGIDRITRQKYKKCKEEDTSGFENVYRSRK